MNLYIGILAAGLTFSNSIFTGSIKFNIIALNFFSAVLVYNLDRLFSFSEDFENTPERALFIKENIPSIRFIVALCLFFIGVLLPGFSLRFYLTGLALGLITLVYLLGFSVKFLSGFQKSLEKFAFIKPVLLAIVWTLATILLPISEMFESNERIGWFLPAIVRFSEFFSNGIFFDYRDRKGDLLSNKGNIFNQWPAGRVFRILGAALTLETLLIIYGIGKNILPGFLIADIVVLFFFILFCLISLNEKSELNALINRHVQFYTIFVDGILFLPVLYAIFAKIAGITY